MTKEEREVMQMALDVLSPDPYKSEWLVAMDMDKAIKAIQKCLANDALDRKAENARELGLDYEPEQEPCSGCGGSGWVLRDPDIGTDQECFVCEVAGVIKPEQEPVAFEKTVCPFCTSEWVTAEQHDRNVDRVERLPLTDEEALELWNKHEKHWRFENNVLAFTRAIEAAHGIKE